MPVLIFLSLNQSKNKNFLISHKFFKTVLLHEMHSYIYCIYIQWNFSNLDFSNSSKFSGLYIF